MELTCQQSTLECVRQLQKAFQADVRQRHQAAVVGYMQGAEGLLLAAKDPALSVQLKQVLKSKCQQYLDRIHVIKTSLDSGAIIPANTAPDKSGPNMAGLDDDSKSCIESWSRLPFKDSEGEVGGLGPTKEFLWTNVVLPVLFPGLPGGVTRVKRGVLLYGLPGTGKTMLLCAMAARAACPVVRVGAHDLISVWAGQDAYVSKVKDLFVWARLNQPCIVCLDDLEALGDPDLDSEGSVFKMVREELTSQLKPMSSENQVTVVAATQSPWYLSGMLRRKFDRRFHIDLPGGAERAQIFKQKMTGIKHDLIDSDFDRVGHMTSGFTGADISSLARSCAMAPVRLIQSATHFRKVELTSTVEGQEVTQEMMTPCEGDAPGAVEITWEFLNFDRVQEPGVTMAGVEKELERTKPSMGESDLQKMKKWAEEFGQE